MRRLIEHLALIIIVSFINKCLMSVMVHICEVNRHRIEMRSNSDFWSVVTSLGLSEIISAQRIECETINSF